MTSTRAFLIRSSIVLNALLLTYLCVSWTAISPSSRTKMTSLNNDFVDENSNDLIKRHPLGQNPSLFSQEFFKRDNNEIKGFSSSTKSVKSQIIPMPEANKSVIDIIGSKKSSVSALGQDDEIKDAIVKPAGVGEEYQEPQEPPREVQEKAGVTEIPMPAAPLAEEIPDPPLNSLERKMFPNLRDCPTKVLQSRLVQRGDYWIQENYVPAAMSFRCDESITYSTHGDYTFLDNLDPLTSRWQGPVSVSVYAPGTDFEATVNSILYVRNCMAEGVKKYVTFHIFFHMNHVPSSIPTTENILQRKTACDKDPPKWSNVTTYRQQKNLLYPVNVARNIARSNSATYFNFPSDIELYPSINVIPEFFKMLKKPDFSKTNNPRVFVFPIFEIKEDENPPETKAELQKMLATKRAFPFHKYICPKCHNVPKYDQWLKANMTNGLSVFNIGKRSPPFNKWEPIYIGTEREPVYDERLSWEGKSDKMTQMYILCVRDYEFHILDNAFLVHRPGIKKSARSKIRDKIASHQSHLIMKKILPEYKTIFGYRKGCII